MTPAVIFTEGRALELIVIKVNLIFFCFPNLRAASLQHNEVNIVALSCEVN
jgi:hypothetical protein